jgi:hypothetical protein
MTPADREFALKALDDSRERLLAAVRGLSREQLEYRPAPDRWSVAENLEHIILAETFVLSRLESPEPQTSDSSKRSRWDGRDEPLVRKLAQERVDRFEAPEALRPIGRWPIEELLAEFEAARALSREFAASTQRDLRSRVFRHPAPTVGEIDGYQLLRLIGAHCERHCAQSEEVMALPGFPRQREETAGRG